MAQENVEFTYNNFCYGALNGTFCSVDTTNTTTVLSTKNSSGSTVGSQYPFNPTITQDVSVGSLEYTGPRYLNANEMKSGLPFFTLEHNSSTQCTIKQWRLDTVNVELDLYRTITKSDTGSYRFNCYDMAVEHYVTDFDIATTTGTGKIKPDSLSYFEVGDEVLLGPSSDLTNQYAYEWVDVTSVSGGWLYINTATGSGVAPLYEYASTDPITFYKDIYLFSDTGQNGSTTKGSLYRIDSKTGTVSGVQDSGVFSGIRASAWGILYDDVAFVKGSNLFHVGEGAGGDYEISKSHALTNIRPDEVTVFSIYDLAFDGSSIYRLQGEKTMVNDSGDKTTYNWSTYNYHQDTIQPYTKSVVCTVTPGAVLLNQDTVTLTSVVIDQFGVGLIGKLVQFSKTSGDSGGYFTPANGQVYTNASGIASLTYTAGWYNFVNPGDDTENIIIKIRSDGASTYTGSQYVWDGVELLFHKKFTMEFPYLVQKPTLSGTWPVEGSDLYSQMYVNQVNDESEMQTFIYLKSLSKFQFPGGHWVGASPPSDTTTRVSQVLNFESEKLFMEIDPEVSNELPVQQLKDKSNDFQLSQPHISRHMLAGHKDTTDIDQFTFVEDAIPAFFSYKNPVYTNIWIRLRPFAFSLNQSTLVFKVREISYAGDTNYRDVSTDCTITTFDAGGGLLGLDILYNPPNDYHHNGIVYVALEVYDVAPTPNIILTDYWFKIIPDYKTPYITNEYPERGAEDVDVGTNISFDLYDVGVGVDINSLEFYVNNRLTTPTVSGISGGYHISHNSTRDFNFSQTCEITVKVKDMSDNQNQMYDMWRFYCEGSTGPWIDRDSFYPKNCTKGSFRRLTGIEFNVFAVDDTGLDKNSIMVTIGGKDRNVQIIPIIYRIS